MCEEGEKITVLVVEDHPLFREALRGYVNGCDDMTVVAEVDNQESALKAVEEQVPDVILMDLVLHRDRSAGLETIQRIKEISPASQILVLTAHDEDDLVFPAFQVGAVGYLLKDFVYGEDVAEAVREVYRGRPPLDAVIARKLIGYFQGQAPEADAAMQIYREPLTEREEEVLELIVRKKTNKEIAEELNISIKTVKTHVSNILQKLHLSNRTEAAIWARIRNLGAKPNEAESEETER